MIFFTILWPVSFVTVRNSSCGKVMFSQASICPRGWGRSLSRGVPAQGGPCPGGSLSRGVSVTENPVRQRASGTLPTGMHCCYHPHSCGKVMFLHLSFGHSVHRGECAPVHARIDPLGRHPLPGQTPLGQTSPCPVHAGIHMATASDGTHSTGLCSCFIVFLEFLSIVTSRI